MANVIKVKTEELVAKAGSLKTRAGQMRQQFSDIQSKVTNTQYYWIGDAGDKKRKEYRDKLNRIDELLRRLDEYPVDLMEMAGIYAQAEQENSQNAQALAGDVIV